MQPADILNVPLGLKFALNMLLINGIAKYLSPVHAKLVGAALLALHTANLVDAFQYMCEDTEPSLECTKSIAENVFFCIYFFVGSLCIIWEYERGGFRRAV